jgi:hypothetical protein
LFSRPRARDTHLSVPPAVAVGPGAIEGLDAAALRAVPGAAAAGACDLPRTPLSVLIESDLREEGPPPPTSPPMDTADMSSAEEFRSEGASGPRVVRRMVRARRRKEKGGRYVQTDRRRDSHSDIEPHPFPALPRVPQSTWAAAGRAPACMSAPGMLPWVCGPRLVEPAVRGRARS